VTGCLITDIWSSQELISLQLLEFFQKKVTSEAKLTGNLSSWYLKLIQQYRKAIYIKSLPFLKLPLLHHNFISLTLIGWKFSYPFILHWLLKRQLNYQLIWIERNLNLDVARVNVECTQKWKRLDVNLKIVVLFCSVQTFILIVSDISYFDCQLVLLSAW